ncbi:MAG: AsmA-like C-terminal region-containing protein, partial [Alphaproteobacteria bacterium]
DERPTIAGRLTFETLDLTEYYGDQGFEDLMEQDAKLAEPGTEDWIFPETPLPFELLSEADITDFKVEIANLQVDPDVVITDISSILSLKDSALHLSELRGRIYDGDVTGDFKAFQGAAAPAIHLKLKGVNLDYGVFLKAFDITERLRGRMDIQLDLDGHGTSLRAIASGLDGRIDFNAREGQIDREMLGLLAFGAGSILGPLVGKDDKGKLECIVTSFTFEDGLGDTLVQYYETSFFAMAGDGKIDLKTETLDFLYHPKAQETSLMKLATPFRVSGSLQSPDVKVDAGGTLLAAAKTAGTIASFINPLIGLGVLAGEAVMKDRNGCETANLVQRGEIPVADPDPESNPFLRKKDRN